MARRDESGKFIPDPDALRAGIYIKMKPETKEAFNRKARSLGLQPTVLLREWVEQWIESDVEPVPTPSPVPSAIPSAATVPSVVPKPVTRPQAVRSGNSGLIEHSDGLQCPKCGNTGRFTRNGLSKGKTRYRWRCSSCGAIFVDTR